MSRADVAEMNPPAANHPPIPPRQPVSAATMVSFAALCGCLAFLLNGYQFGVGDQIDHLPLVLRAMNPDYLPNDPYVASQAGFNVRWYYCLVLAQLGRAVPLPAVFFVLLLACTVAVSILTALAARDLFDGEALSGMLACAAAVTVIPFHLGNDATVFSNMLLPESLAMPLVLYGLWKGVRGQFVVPAAACGVAALFHPLVGLECGGLALIAATVCRIGPGGGGRPALRAAGGALAAGCAILGAFALVWIVPERAAASSAERVDTATFIEILAYLRNPHHYVPSTWPARLFVKTALFLAAAFLAWTDMRRRAKGANNPARPMAALVVAVLALWPGGYVFVEILPVRLWVVAQVFRLGFVIAWIGLMLLAATASHRLLAGHFRRGCLAALGLASGPAAFVSQAYLWLADRRPLKGFPAPRWRLLSAIALAAAAIGADPGPWGSLAALLISWVGVYLALRASRSGACLLPPAAGIVVVSMLFIIDRTGLSPCVTNAIHDIRPRIVLSDSADQEYFALAEYACNHTEQNAIFLTPPYWGGFRLTAQRAIVVDWKCDPFQARELVRWRRRLEDCYGQPHASTYADGELERNYDNITDARIRQLSEIHGFNYAVLHADTPTSSLVLAAQQGFKLIRVR